MDASLGSFHSMMNGRIRIMKHIRRTNEEWMELITQCRCSGLSDERWCRDHGIPVSTFYRHVRLLRQKACDVPAVVRGDVSPKQEVVPVQVTDIREADRAKNSFPMPETGVRGPAIRIHLGSAYIDIMDHADTTLLSAAVMALKTLC